MEENNQFEDWLKDLPVQGENPAFKPEQMIVCENCARTNPPNRLKCLYCNAELNLDENLSLKPRLRKLESWEQGFNLIFLPEKSEFSEESTAEVSQMLNLETEIFGKILKSKNSLPLVRAESERETGIVQKNLLEFGIETLILSDEALAIDKHPQRLRGIEFLEDKIVLILFNQDEIIEIAREDLVLIVTGAIFERKISATEKHSKKGGNKILQTTETASDEGLIDIYSRRDAFGFRIMSKGFDFSCLGAEKEILSSLNMRNLVAKFQEIAPSAKLADEYLRARELLSIIWEVEQKSDLQGVKRGGFGQYNRQNTTTINNLSQFTKYSRLRRHLL